MYTSINEANDAVIARIKAARPHWLDVKPAASVILNCVKAACCCMPGRQSAGRR
nr:putative cytoplasmic protein [Raoultella sp. NCTC 9187]